MPVSDSPEDPNGRARSPAVPGHRREGAGNERPQRRAGAPGLEGGVGVYWDEWSPCWLLVTGFPFSPGPFSLIPGLCLAEIC